MNMTTGTKRKHDVSSAAPAEPPKPITVLYMDDSAIARKLFSRKLSEAGFDVLCVTDGAAALELVAQDPDRFNVVLSDVVTAHGTMDGLALLEAVKTDENPAVRNQPIIMLTSVADDAEPTLEPSCLRGGAAGFLRKPLKLAEFNSCLGGLGLL